MRASIRVYLRVCVCGGGWGVRTEDEGLLGLTMSEAIELGREGCYCLFALALFRI